ncbi:MAG: class I SAM-dependent methyltransferase [Candidatus Schekmanbacteria bacterium]|nr:class I SAM-dependent methyltransferase [Candidatus Schekmanbacteria bacterium]
MARLISETRQGFAQQTLQNRHVVRALNEVVYAVLGRRQGELNRGMLLALQEVERRLELLEAAVQDLRTGAETGAPAVPESATSGTGAPAVAAGVHPYAARALSEAAYNAFQETFRGDDDALRRHYQEHLPTLASAQRACAAAGITPARVLDVGCGRGTFLSALAEAKIAAFGIDSSAAAVALAQARGLDAVRADAAEFLAAVPPQSLAAVVSSHVLEHLSWPEVRRFFDLSLRTLAAGGVLIAETINPTCLFAYVNAFLLDPTHCTPLHPEALRFVAEASGFRTVQVQFFSPVPDASRLQVEGQAPPAAWGARNVERLNELLYGPQEYAIVAWR